MAISFVSMVMNFALNWYFVRVMHWGHESLALTTSLIAAWNFVLLVSTLRRFVEEMSWRSLVATLARCAIAAALMGGICWAANRHVLSTLGDMGWLFQAIALGVVIAIGAGVYFGLCYVLGVSEARDCLGMLLRRIPGLKRFAPKAGK
jgi:putative peptidoglycan lipid II flippase